MTDGRVLSARVPAVYLIFAFQADALVAKITPHFG